jgi:hypothetical protein
VVILLIVILHSTPGQHACEVTKSKSSSKPLSLLLLLIIFFSLSLSFPLSPLLKLIWRARARAPSAKSVQKTSR